MNAPCPFCRNDIELGDRIGRRETCPRCNRDLHVCLCCRFYAPGAYNDCREPQAERVVIKDRSNFCDFFAFRDGSSLAAPANGRSSSRDRLESLFKK